MHKVSFGNYSGEFDLTKKAINSPKNINTVMDLIEVGYIWYDSNGTVLQTNKFMDDVILKKLGIASP